MPENFYNYPSRHFTPISTKYAILLKEVATLGEELEIIGVVGTNETGQDLQIVYVLHCGYWRKGYMTEALIAAFGGEGAYWSLPSTSLQVLLFMPPTAQLFFGTGLCLTDTPKSQTYQDIKSPNRPRECRFHEEYWQNWGKKGRDSLEII
jgi:hypothetical protein